MAFTGGYNISTKKSGNSQQKSFYDMLVTVKEYDLGAGTIKVETSQKRLMDVSIEPEALSRQVAYMQSANIKSTTFLGHLIDQNMKKHIPENNKVILDKCHIIRNVKQDGNNVAIAQVEKVWNVTVPAADKTFEGIFSVIAKDGRVSFVQHWNKTAIGEGEVGLDELKASMDNVLVDYKKVIADSMIVKPTIGVQFRAIVENTEADKEKKKYVVVDTSRVFDWIPAPRDESGALIGEGHPLDPENFDVLWNGYLEYAKEKYAGKEGMKFEVCWYNNFRGGPKSTSLNIKESKYAPLNQLAYTKTRLDEDVKNEVVGKNWATYGVIQLSDNQLKRDDSSVAVDIPRYYVTKLHANGPKGHVHAFVASSDGGGCKPHDNLKRVIESDDSKPTEAPAVVKANLSSTQSIASGDADDFDPFSEEPNNPKDKLQQASQRLK